MQHSVLYTTVYSTRTGKEWTWHTIRRALITEKVKLLLTLYRPLPPPFLLSKAKASCSSPLPLKKVSKNCTLSGASVATARLTEYI